MTYKLKYKPGTKWPIHSRPKGVAGIKPNPDYYTEEGMIERDIHYGYLKHKAQAKFRSEDYSLTPEQWKELWTVENWLQRGRSKHSLCLMQIKHGEGWHFNNVTIVERIECLRRSKEYRRDND